MTDRWVAALLLVWALQVPLYLHLGHGPLAYDLHLESAEEGLMRPPSPEKAGAIREHLAAAEHALQTLGGQSRDSRWARLDRAAAVLAWHEGNTSAADAFFRRSLEVYEATQGPDSFPTCMASLQYAEFLVMTRRYDEALLRLELGTRQLEDSVGPGSSLVTRAVFVHVGALTDLGRQEDALRKATPCLDDLLEHAGKFDLLFLTRTGQTLDLLCAAGLPKPRSEETWQQALAAAHQENPVAADDDEAN